MTPDQYRNELSKMQKGKKRKAKLDKRKAKKTKERTRRTTRKIGGKLHQYVRKNMHLARTIKIPVKQEDGDAFPGIAVLVHSHSIFDSPRRIIMNREAYCNMIADKADKGVYYHEKDYYIVKAEITDTGEVWARIVPEDKEIEEAKRLIQLKLEQTKTKPPSRMFEHF